MKRKLSMNFIHQYTVTLFTWLLVVVVINMLNFKDAHALSYILITISILILYYLFFQDKGRRFIYILFPVSTIIMWLLDYHWLAVLIGAFLPILKIEYLHHDEEASRPELSIVISFIIVMTLNFISFDVIADYMMWLYGIVILQVVYYFLGRFVVLTYKNGRPLTSNLKVSLSAIAAFVALGIGFGFSFRYIIQYGTYVVLFILNGFIFLLRPLFNGLENVELDYPEFDTEEEELQEEAMEEEELTQSSNEFLTNVPMELIAVILLIVVVIIILVVYFMKRGDLSRRAAQQEDESNTVTHERPIMTKHTFKSTDSPDDKVRKVYFEFERWLAKKDIGRYHTETISDWLKRHNFESIIQTEDFDAYRKVRYYGERVNEDEFKYFVKRIDEIKTTITDRRLNNKD